jgi:hypothetical protein
MKTTPGAVRVLLLGVALLLLTSAPAFSQTTNPSDGTSQTPDGSSQSSQSTPQTPSTPQNKPATTSDQSDRLRVNPVTGQTTAKAENYTPLTKDERWKLYVKQSFFSVGAYFGPFFSALVLDQTTDSPREWGGGFPGYGRRVLSRFASNDIVQNGIQFPMAALLKEDVRYIASDQHGFGRRTLHAILFSVLTFNNQGHTTLNVANITGYYGATAVSTLWLPGSKKTAGYIFSNGSESIALSMPINELQEFWPEISRTVLHRRK